MSECKHEKARFIPCHTADRYPGIWYCDDCNTRFNSDPLHRTSVRYLDHSNPANSKTLPPFKANLKG